MLAAGQGRLLSDGTLRPLQLKAGDQVLFGKYAGQTVKVDDEELLVLREDDVLALVESSERSGLKRVA